MPHNKYAIFNKMIEGVQVIAPDYTYLYVNETVTKHGKYSKEDLLGYTMMEKYPGIETTGMFEYLQRCMEDHQAHQMVNEFDFPDGSKGYFELRMQRVDDGVLIFSYDITKVKRAEQLIKDTNKELEQRVEERTNELKKSEERFQLAVAGTSAGIWDWFDMGSEEQWWSPKFYTLLGYEDKEIPATRMNFRDLVHPDDLNAALDAINKHYQQKKKFEVEYRLRTKSGEYKWFLGNAQAIWDEEDNPQRLVGTIIDIHKQKVAQELLRLRSQELEQRNKELKEFVYVASHDLQEPVRTIASFVNLFSNTYRDKVDEEGQKMIDFMKGATERSQNLIIDLLDYSRLGKNKSMEKIKLDKLVKEAIDDLNAKVKEKNAEISITPLPEVNGLKTELRLLFQNLVGNAIKFSKPDETPLISIGAHQLNGHWEFTVKDNGIGFDPRHNENIFVVFKRLNNREAYEGTGIGLAQCKRIVELHGGKIWAESQPGEGSTFYFTLPAI